MKTLLCLIALTTTLAVEAQTSEALLDYSPNLNELGYGYTAGWSFQPATNISLTALGAFQYLVANSGNIVGLWDASGALLASNSITASSLLVNQSLYEPITPVSLSADETYYLGAYSPRLDVNLYLPLKFWIRRLHHDVTRNPTRDGRRSNGFRMPCNDRKSPRIRHDRSKF
jgi:hypothetical protein